MKTLLNLAWLALAITEITLSYLFVWQWAQSPDLAAWFIAAGLLNAAWAISGLRSPKVKFRYIGV